MVQSAKLAVTLIVLALIQCAFGDGSLWRRYSMPEQSEQDTNTKSAIKGAVEQERSMLNEAKYDTGGQGRSRRGLAKAIPIIQLGITVLTKVLDTLGSIQRKIAIGIGNDTPFMWKDGQIYFSSGTSDDIFPALLNSKEAVIFPARKTSGPVATGAVGVLCYHIADRKKSLCVLYSVPFDYNLYSNWWDVKVFPGKKSPNHQLYMDMYYGNPYKGDGRHHGKDLGYGFKLVDGSMNDSGNAKLMMKITTN